MMSLVVKLVIQKFAASALYVPPFREIVLKVFVVVLIFSFHTWRDGDIFAGASIAAERRKFAHNVLVGVLLVATLILWGERWFSKKLEGSPNARMHFSLIVYTALSGIVGFSVGWNTDGEKHRVAIEAVEFVAQLCDGFTAVLLVIAVVFAERLVDPGFFHRGRLYPFFAVLALVSIANEYAKGQPLLKLLEYFIGLILLIVASESSLKWACVCIVSAIPIRAALDLYLRETVSWRGVIEVVSRCDLFVFRCVFAAVVIVGLRKPAEHYPVQMSHFMLFVAGCLLNVHFLCLLDATNIYNWGLILEANALFSTFF